MPLETDSIMRRCIKCNMTPKALGVRVLIPLPGGGHKQADPSKCHIDGGMHDFQQVAVVDAEGRMVTTKK